MFRIHNPINGALKTVQNHLNKIENHTKGFCLKNACFSRLFQPLFKSTAVAKQILRESRLNASLLSWQDLILREQDLGERVSPLIDRKDAFWPKRNSALIRLILIIAAIFVSSI